MPTASCLVSVDCSDSVTEHETGASTCPLQS
jgi:hypothetical protein